MKKTWIALAIPLVFCILAVDARAATVAGTVTFVSRRGQAPSPAETLVWLDSTTPSKPRKSESVEMITKSKTIIPHVVAVPVGSTVQFPNQDPILHNIFSVSASNAFDVGLYGKGAGKSTKLEKAGIVNVYCNVHPNMSAVVHVMQTPWYTFAESSGGFRIDGVPPGKYRLNAWNERGGTTVELIEVTEEAVRGKTTLALDSRQYRARQHLNKMGQPYPRKRSNEY